MDNIAHTLAGLTLGCALLEVMPGPPSHSGHSGHGDRARFRAAVLWTSVVANNLPDVDSVFSEIFEPGKLGQLLNHRGYMHSFVFVPFGAMISAVIGLWIVFHGWSFRSSLRSNFWPWFWKMTLVGAAGILLHLFMDGWNDYGIHPFSPFWNKWIHADGVAVVEPLLWLAILPFAWVLSEGSRIRILILGLLGGILGILWFGPFARGGVALGATLWAGLAWWIQARFSRTSGNRAWAIAAALAGTVVLVFFVGSRAAGRRVASLISPERAKEKVFQLIRSPAPADPLCWRIIVVSERISPRGNDYVMRYGVMSLWPRFVNPRTCYYGAFGERLAPLTPVRDLAPERNGTHDMARDVVDDLAWVGEFARPMSELERLTRTSCEFEAFRRFSRAPFWVAGPGGREIFGDLRYDGGRKPGFSAVTAGSGCLKWEPPWQYQVPEASGA